MNLHRNILLALAAQLALAGTAGCKKDKPADEDTTSTDTPTDNPSADPAAADSDTKEADPSVVTDVGPTAATDPLPAPPAAKVEEQGTAPNANSTWVEGYWWWDTSKKDYEWSPGFWQDRTVEATSAAPEPQYEDPGRAPGEGYTYLPGWWRWDGSTYLWYHGYWGPHRDGWAYMHPYWEARGGRWYSAGWGWEHYNAGWEAAHVGWEFHGGIWERPADFRIRVTIATAHAADFRVAPGAWHGHVYGRADVDVHGRVSGAPAGAHPGDAIHESHPRPAVVPVARGGQGPAHAGGGHVPVTPGEAHAEHPGAAPAHEGAPGHTPVTPAEAHAEAPAHASPPTHEAPAHESPAHVTPAEAHAESPSRETPARPSEPAHQVEHKPTAVNAAEARAVSPAHTTAAAPAHTAPAARPAAAPAARPAAAPAKPAAAPPKKH